MTFTLSTNNQEFIYQDARVKKTPALPRKSRPVLRVTFGQGRRWIAAQPGKTAGNGAFVEREENPQTGAGRVGAGHFALRAVHEFIAGLEGVCAPR